MSVEADTSNKSTPTHGPTMSKHHKPGSLLNYQSAGDLPSIDKKRRHDEELEVINNDHSQQHSRRLTILGWSLGGFLTILLGGSLGASLGLGETKGHLGTSLKEFGVSLFLVLATAAVFYWVLKRQEKWQANKKLFFGIFAAILIPLIIAYGTLQALNSAGVVDSYLDQHNSRIAAKKLQDFFGVKDPLAFQAHSYEFGYTLLAGLCVIALAMVYYRYKHLQQSKDHNLVATKKNTKTAIFGITFGIFLLAVNSGFHGLAAGFASSTRPIFETKWADMALNPSWWANIDGMGQVSNAGKHPDSNWYSGHTSFVGTAFWLLFFCMILYTKYYCSEKEDLLNKPHEKVKSGWLLFFGWVGVFILFSMTAATAICRVGGTAHTINAVVSGFIIPMFTVLLGMGMFSIMRDHPRRAIMLGLTLGIAYGGYEIFIQHSINMGMMAIGVSALSLLVCVGIKILKPTKVICGINTESFWNKEKYLFQSDNDINANNEQEYSKNAGSSRLCVE
jgi:hypothetical protein